MSTPYDLDTPSLLIDLDVMERNIAEMAEVARAAGVRLRPHTKTHKSPEIARMQLDAGASGITVAKLGEAEVMVDAGIDDVLVAYPLVGEIKLARLRALMARARIRTTTDSVEVAEGLGRVGRDLGRDVEVLIEVDTGLHRVGRAPGAPTVELVQRVAQLPGVEVIGLLTHAGHAYRSANADELRVAAEREVLDLVETAAVCAEAGIELREISVGSTPTARIGAGVPGATEIRPGTYVFNDVQQMRLGVATLATCALRVLATVVAHPTPDRFVLDAGTKAFTSDGGDGPPYPGRGVIAGRPELRLDFMNEEHAVGHRTGEDDVRIGDRLQVVPLHACACVNMFDVAYGVREDVLQHEIAIGARGADAVMRGLSGKGVLVSGAGRGIGEAAVRRFLEEGCRVFLCARHADGVDEALRTLRPLGEVEGMACDVSVPGDVERLVAAADASLGGIDVLANNAGVAWQEPFLEITLEHWDEILDINLRGMFLVAQAVARRMVARGRGGSIVNMSSTNAFEGEAGYAHYNASKGAISMLTRTMATELGPHGIRVNALCPGKIFTPLQGEAEDPEYTARYEREKIPLGRSGTVEEVAAAYAFLASDEATFITGELLVIDGGQLAM